MFEVWRPISPSRQLVQICISPRLYSRFFDCLHHTFFFSRFCILISPFVSLLYQLFLFSTQFRPNSINNTLL